MAVVGPLTLGWRRVVRWLRLKLRFIGEDLDVGCGIAPGRCRRAVKHRRRCDDGWWSTGGHLIPGRLQVGEGLLGFAELVEPGGGGEFGQIPNGLQGAWLFLGWWLQLAALEPGLGEVHQGGGGRAARDRLVVGLGVLGLPQSVEVNVTR